MKAKEKECQKIRHVSGYGGRGKDVRGGGIRGGGGGRRRRRKEDNTHGYRSRGLQVWAQRSLSCAVKRKNNLTNLITFPHSDYL